MGTRSLIAKQIGTDAYRTIFCQRNGHLEYLGDLLIKHCSASEQVDRLLELGDLKTADSIAVAEQEIEDSGNVDAEIHSLAELDESDGMIEFIYIFDRTDSWKYFQGGYLDAGLRDVKEDLQALEQGIDILKDPKSDFEEEFQDDRVWEGEQMDLRMQI